MKINELHNQPVQADTYEASMALNQLLKIGKHAIKIHNMIDDSAEMESWVAKKIDLAGDYVKKVHGYMQGEKAGLYDDGGMTEDANNLETAYKQIAMLANNVTKEPTDADDQMDVADDVARPITKILSTIMDYDKGEQMPDGSASKTTYVDMYKKLGMLANKGAQTNDPKVAPLLFKIMSSIYDMDKVSEGSIQEDAGEGHMSKSTLYHTAKYAIELMDMINQGDDLEGWVQSKLNKAADYLQGVHNYEEYQKLNPYREELDSDLLQRHAGIIQKNIDEILARETSLDDVDTKPGMMRILAKRVNEVEKKIAKETRKKTDESGILYRAGVKKYGKAGMKAIQSAAGKGASHQEIGKIKDKHLKDAQELDEGLKDWARNLAAAGIIVGAVAGMGSINNAIDNSVPAVKAMNTAYEMAVDAGNDELAKNIKNDISAVKVRLDSGKDLNFVKAMQEKYAKFIQTEGLAYESQLALALNQQLK